MNRDPQIGNEYRSPATGTVRQRDGRISVTINTADLDRHGTVIDPQGAELAHYKNNPIVLAGHSMAKVLGTSEVRLEGGKLVARMTRWSESAIAEKWRADVEAGIVRAASIGFRVLDKQREQAPDGTAYTRITRWQLIEWSWVSVPSNPHAVVRAIQPLTLRGDGSKRFPKKVPIHFSDEQFERLMSGELGSAALIGERPESERPRSNPLEGVNTVHIGGQGTRPSSSTGGPPQPTESTPTRLNPAKKPGPPPLTSRHGPPHKVGWARHLIRNARQGNEQARQHAGRQGTQAHDSDSGDDPGHVPARSLR